MITALLCTSVNYHIATAYDRQIYTDVDHVPANKVGLLLGTAKLVEGRPNLYYESRLAAAVRLYQSRKITKILVSGDNSSTTYDEPTDFMNDLIDRGVAANDIYLDYAGFRTLDSMVRAKAIFGLSSVTVISQPFHCERALFIARNTGLEAVAFAAPDIQHPSRFLIEFRELLARVKAGLDVWVLGTKPKFYGEPIDIV